MRSVLTKPTLTLRHISCLVGNWILRSEVLEENLDGSNHVGSSVTVKTVKGEIELK